MPGRAWSRVDEPAAEPGRHGHDWATLALDSGYFDQSHLIRDFQDFTGASPDVHLANR